MTRTNQSNAPLSARTDRRFIRSAHRSERFVLVGIEAPPAPSAAARDAVNLAFVLDRSGSMSGQKLDLAKRAVETAIDRLLPTDRFSVVCYDDRIDVVVEGVPASREAKANAIERLRAIDARGSTDLAGGWLRGAEQVALGQLNLVAGGVNRVLLLTDGLANVGVTDPAELARHAAELRARWVTTTTFGVGGDFDEALLQSLADAGGGHFYFIENAAQILDHVATEVGELLAIVARDVVLEITAPEAVSLGTLSPYPMDRHGSRATLRLGDLVAEQRLEVVLRLKFPYGTVGEEIGVLLAVGDREGVLNLAGAAPIGVGWEFADDRTNDSQARDRSVDVAVARLFAARARQEAVALNRAGEYQAAAGVLKSVARKVAAYAGSDPSLGNVVAELREEEARWAAPAPEMLRKSVHAAASYVQRNRAPQGGATR
jgi:Ca-activated chloride channel family protein